MMAETNTVTERKATVAPPRRAAPEAGATDRAGQPRQFLAERRRVTIDGNEAVASVAYRFAEVAAIYPITPSSTMAELADEWSVAGRPNLWGTVPEVLEMQSEAGAAGTVHGALQAGALATSFTSSQGLLLFIPDMYRIAGEFLPCCLHVSARAIATHALSIFGDHQDVMACRQTGFALLSAASVQEAHDLAAVAHAATLESRVPFVHFMDGFRTSHEVNTVELLSDDDLRSLIDEEWVRAHRERALSPEHPVLWGGAVNPDTYFQGREAGNRFYQALPAIVMGAMERFAALTGRGYHLFDYAGHPEAERVLVIMGSGAEVADETVEALVAAGERVGVVKVRLFRPFSIPAFVAALPPTVKAIAVLDRTKEPGAVGEPLYLEVVAALAQSGARAGGRAGQTPGHPTPTGQTLAPPPVVGGRYGLGSKEFDPAMVKAVFDALGRDAPRHGFTVGIKDDLTGLSLDVDESFQLEAEDTVRAVLFGLGADGTVGASKNTVKIIGGEPGRYAQGYFVYDSKKSGSITVSHLRFGRRPIRSSYLVKQADFVACHQYRLLDKLDLLTPARPGGTVLLNTPYPPEEVWDSLSREVQQEIIDKQLDVWTIDAFGVAEEFNLGFRINVIMQTCFFAITRVMPIEEAIARIKESIEKTYGKKGGSIVTRNLDAVDRTLARLHRLEVPSQVTATRSRPGLDFDDAVGVVRDVIAPMMEWRGDEVPVSVHPADGTWPMGTTKYEKRNMALEIPIWDPQFCIQCGKCSFSCPHSTIRTKLVDPGELAGAPATFRSVEAKGARFAGKRYIVQVAPEDCTGCRLCVAACPGRDRSNPSHRAINMEPHHEHLDIERENYSFFLDLPSPTMAGLERDGIPVDVKASQLLQPLFEYCGACAGCGETQYVRLLSQLFGDRLLIANATGCSSIYSGNLPSTAFTQNAAGRGPAWANSLFEDNAEFGLGFRLAVDKQEEVARELLTGLAPRVATATGERLVDQLLTGEQESEQGVAAQRERVLALRRALAAISDPAARRLEAVADFLVRRSIWIVGGDGWAYDIGFGGLDHVLSVGRDVNVLVLDTEIYSNTGGQASKATPLGAVAKFAAAGKIRGKKDLGLMAMTYGHVYVAQVAWGARDAQTVQALREAESYHGTSLVIGYSHCVGHGYDLSYGRDQQTLAVESGRWPLYRFDPRRKEEGLHPLQLDSKEPWASFHDFAEKEIRFRMLERLDPARSRRLFAEADRAARRHYRLYQKLAEIDLDGGEPPTPERPGIRLERPHMPAGTARQASTRAAGTLQAAGATPGAREAALEQVSEEARREAGPTQGPPVPSDTSGPGDAAGRGAHRDRGE
jgi:pyruvate-ferredoxin/flavodoxin oxidoreductase